MKHSQVLSLNKQLKIQTNLKPKIKKKTKETH